MCVCMETNAATRNRGKSNWTASDCKARVNMQQTATQHKQIETERFDTDKFISPIQFVTTTIVILSKKPKLW